MVKKNVEEILHTQEIKKKYNKVEREIKRKLTEILLLNGIGFEKNICRGLSITKDFQIREISPKENSKFISNPATIKSPVISITKEQVKQDLFKLIDKKITETEIAQKYKSGIDNFFVNLGSKNTKNIMHVIEQNENKSDKFLMYLSQCRQSTNVKKKNVKMQLAKILYSKFGEEAFDTKHIKGKEKTSICILSEKSLQYIRTIFYNATKVRESWGKSIDKVFHDGDYPFIIENKLETENNYIDVLVYLVDKGKSNFYGKRGGEGQAEWSRKTSQYADILWTLTSDQLGIHNIPNDTESFEFKRDDITQNLSKIGGGLLENVITTHNMRETSPEKKLTLSKRNKSITSSVEKTIEGRTLNDIIGLRISAKGISDHNFEDIKKISKRWIDDFDASLKTFPNKYVPKGYTISISQVLVDNKGVLDDDIDGQASQSSQVDEIVKELNSIVVTKKRDVPVSPYIDQVDRENRMKKYYPEVTKNEKKWKTMQSFYKRIAGGKRRGKNGSYKDFKFNIKFDIKDRFGKIVGNRFMEVQFDDLENSKGLANYNIRNFERRLNTQSRLSFSVPLSQARKNCEKKLKEMRLYLTNWPKSGMSDEEKKKFFEINFDDGSLVDVSQFKKRSVGNSDKMDEAIVKIINYFLKKGTFILCNGNDLHGGEYSLKDGLIQIEDLHNREKADSIHICSNLELSSQQHSYLQQNRDRKVGIYLEDDKNIGRVTLGELVDSMNLGKVKDKKYSLDI